MNRVNGRVLTQAEHIKQSIEILLTTAPGERVMRPTYGCDLQSYIDAPINGDTLLDMQIAITDAIETFEPRATVNAVRISADAGALHTGHLAITIDGNFGISTINY